VVCEPVPGCVLVAEIIIFYAIAGYVVYRLYKSGRL